MSTEGATVRSTHCGLKQHVFIGHISLLRFFCVPSVGRAQGNGSSHVLGYLPASRYATELKCQLEMELSVRPITLWESGTECVHIDSMLVLVK